LTYSVSKVLACIGIVDCK